MKILMRTNISGGRVCADGARGICQYPRQSREKGHTCHIGKLAVKPDLQDQGIGSMLMSEIESLFPAVDRFELFTGHRSNKNLYLYKKLGYVVYENRFVNDGLTLAQMVKAT